MGQEKKQKNVGLAHGFKTTHGFIVQGLGGFAHGF